MLNIALFITYDIIIRNAECIKWIFDLYVHVIHKIRQSSARIDSHDTEYSESKVFLYNDVYKTTNAIQRQTDRHYTQEDRLGDPFGCEIVHGTAMQYFLLWIRMIN